MAQDNRSENWGLTLVNFLFHFSWAHKPLSPKKFEVFMRQPTAQKAYEYLKEHAVMKRGLNKGSLPMDPPM